MSDTSEVLRKNAQARRIKHCITGCLFVLPCAVVLVLMAIYPLVQVLQFAFSDVKIVGFQTSFCGVENFKVIFADPQFLPILGQTFIWTFVSLALRIVIGFAAALMMDTGMKGKTFFRVTALIPWIVPSIVAANTWRWVYNPDVGLINTFMRWVINPAFDTVWIKTYPLASVIVSYVWTGFPFIMLMVMAGLQAIPADYKEAAKIDGANAFQVFWHIILPNLKSVLIIITVLELITGFNAFDLIFTMTAGGPGIKSTILGIYIYNLAFRTRNLGWASAASVLLLAAFVIIFIFYAPLAAINKKRGGNE